MSKVFKEIVALLSRYTVHCNADVEAQERGRACKGQ